MVIGSKIKLKYVHKWCVVAALIACGGSAFADSSQSNLDVWENLGPVYETQFLGKHTDKELLKRAGGETAVRHSETPWVDWQKYYGVDGEKAQLTDKNQELVIDRFSAIKQLRSAIKNGELNKSMFANVAAKILLGIGRKGSNQTIRVTPSKLLALADLELFRLSLLNHNMLDTNGDANLYVPGQENKAIHFPSLQDPSIDCTKPENRKFRTIDGRCNDIKNPKMGAKGTRFARNVQFKATHGKYSLQDPDPSKVSEILMTRRGKDKTQYRKAPFFNVLAASWIQFMTHDWFSHANKGRNSQKQSISTEKMTIQATLKDQSLGRPRPIKGTEDVPEKTFQNHISFWWDASQIYGSDEEMLETVRDPKDRAKLFVDDNNMLPSFSELGRTKDLFPHEVDQEISGFTDNWWIGLSLLQHAFVREHNLYVDRMRIEYQQNGKKLPTPEEQFGYARLAVAALIAKIHTIEWTPQLLFNPILEEAMNANWHGILGYRKGGNKLTKVKRKFLQKAISKLGNGKLLESNNAFAALAALPGIVGADTNFFGSPFSLPEEFTTVYRLHPLIPDVLEYRTVSDVNSAINNNDASIENRYRGVEAKETIRGKSNALLAKSTDELENWMLSFGMQRLGTLQLHNYPRFLQELEMPHNPAWTHLKGKKQTIDMAAVDVIRDRERGVPRFNEFRRQIGLKPLSSFDDFINMELAWATFAKVENIEYETYADFKARLTKNEITKLKSRCADKACSGLVNELLYQIEQRDQLIVVYDNDLEKVDAIIGSFASNTRPHGFAISETQFQIFILNASRRLLSDRFFTKDYNAKTYTKFGYNWVESRSMLDVLRDNFPGLQKVLANAENAFDPWLRKRNGFRLDWSTNPSGHK